MKDYHVGDLCVYDWAGAHAMLLVTSELCDGSVCQSLPSELADAHWHFKYVSPLAADDATFSKNSLYANKLVVISRGNPGEPD